MYCHLPFLSGKLKDQISVQILIRLIAGGWGGGQQIGRWVIGRWKGGQREREGEIYVAFLSHVTALLGLIVGPLWRDTLHSVKGDMAFHSKGNHKL